jgi:hypothetical protein
MRGAVKASSKEPSISETEVLRGTLVRFKSKGRQRDQRRRCQVGCDMIGDPLSQRERGPNCWGAPLQCN